jgi:hypothetical protein
VASKAGYAMTDAVMETLDAEALIDSVTVSVTEYVGSDLSGSITFLASENSAVDITLLDPETRAVIPGLTVFNEASNLNGDLLWGGFESDGTANHAFIGAAVTSIDYNFDSQPGAPALEAGELYQWRLWADKGTQADSLVEQLISSSEDLRGLFQIPEAVPAN